MATRELRQYADFTGIATGGLATAQVPLGGTHFTYYLRFLTSGGALITEAQLINDVDLIRVKVGGKTYLEFTGEEALRYMEYYYENRMGQGIAAGTLPICLSPDWYTDDLQSQALAWGTSELSNIQIEVQLDGTSITTAKIQLFVERNNLIAGMFRHVRVTRITQNFSATGEQTINNINPKSPEVDALSIGIFYDDNTTTLDQVIFTAEADDVLTLLPDLEQSRQGKSYRLPQTNASGNSLFFIDFALSNDINGYFPFHRPTGNGNAQRPLDDVRVRPTWSTAAPGNFTTLLTAVWGNSPAQG